jgi:hypothetical protein
VPFEDLCSNEKNSYSNKAVFSWENSKKNCSFTTRVVAAQNGNATELVIVNTNDQLVCHCSFTLLNIWQKFP